MEILNQGNLSEYIDKRWQSGRPLNEKSSLAILDNFTESMKSLTEI